MKKTWKVGVLRRVPEFARDKSPIPHVLRASDVSVFSSDSTDKPLISKRHGLLNTNFSVQWNPVCKAFHQISCCGN